MTNHTENQAAPKSYKREFYYITFLAILTILFPFGILAYIWGRLNLMIHTIILLSLPIWLLVLILFVIGIFRLFRKNTAKKKILIFIEVCLLATFFLPFFIPLEMRPNLYDSSHPFLCGYRDRIRSRLDIPAVREWMRNYSESLSTENDNEIIDEYIPPDKLPDCLKPIRNGGAFYFRKYSDEDLKITQGCGGGLSHWWLTIGMEDTPFPESEDYDLWLPVAPGIYVEMD